MAKSLEVILSPALLPYCDVKDRIVVMIDVLRAGTSICVAFQTGVEKILPVASPEECMVFKDFDFVIAAERNAVKVDGFDLGNSPFEYENPLLAGRKIAFTTTNGTKAIRQSREQGASAIVIGSFLNLEFLCDWLRQQDGSVSLLCAGWKNKYNLEDTFFAGAVVKHIGTDYEMDCDAALTAKELYEKHESDPEPLIRRSSHANRFKLLDMHTDDVQYSLQKNITPLLPVLKGEYIVKL